MQLKHVLLLHCVFCLTV